MSKKSRVYKLEKKKKSQEPRELKVYLIFEDHVEHKGKSMSIEEWKKLPRGENVITINEDTVRGVY